MKLKETPEDFIVVEQLLPTFSAGNHSLYLLRKREWNTESCLQWLARSLRIPRKKIGYCGNKDKHACTEQFISIERGPRGVRTPEGFSLTYLGSVAEQLRLGQHERNWFCITVRTVQAPPALRSSHLKNFYGEQRFGGSNADVGLLLLRKRYAEAAKMLGLPFTTDPIGALRTIPKHTLLLYVHAAQSLLWNELAQRVDAPAGTELPLPGFAPSGEHAHLDLLQEILAKHELTPDDFINRSFPELTLEGSARPLYQDVQHLSVSDIHEGRCVLCFSLGKGMYATETIKQAFPEE